MYFWNIDKLVQDLRSGTLTEYEKMKYLLGTVLLQLFAMNNSSQRYEPKNNIEILILALFFGIEVGIVVWGTYHCFIINKQNDNKNFIERYICLGFPIGFRLFVFSILGALVSAFILVAGLALFLPINRTQLISNSSPVKTIIGNSAHLSINGNVISSNGLLKFQVLNCLCILIISIIYYLILGKKIAEVSAQK